VDAIDKFLGIPADEVGIIGGGKFTIGHKVTVALVQTLYRRLDDVAPYVGHIIVDECHRTPSRVFTQAVDAFPAKYRLGLTATPWRRDALSKAIFWHLGDVTGQIEKADLLDQGNLCHASVRWVETSFNTDLDASEHYTTVLSELTQDSERNKVICNSVADLDVDGIVMVLSDRQEHCRKISEIMRDRHHIHAEVLTGSTPHADRLRIVENLRTGSCRHVIATGQLIGEGFDLPGIEALVLATPLKFSGRLIQYVGRALRPAPGKDEAVIIDFVDHLEPVFAASARHRADVYQGQGIRTAS
jgi:superfamily II DNA or RNA helicase